MGCAEIISIDEVRARKQWESLRQQLHTRFDQWLDQLEEQWPESEPTLAAVTETVWDLRQALTGSLTETIVAHTHQDEYTRQQSHCPQCDRLLGPTGGNMRYDAVASLSCIDKALHASVIHL